MTAYQEDIETENEQLRDDLDDIINTLGEVIISIANANDDFVCTECLETAERLYEIIRQHGDENAIGEIAEQYTCITGRSLDG